MLSETHTTAPFRRRLSSDLLRFGNVTQLFFCGLCGADVISGRLAEVEKKVPLSFFVGRNIAWCLVDSHQESEVKTQDVLWLILQGRLVQWFPSQVNVSFVSQCSNPNYSLFVPYPPVCFLSHFYWGFSISIMISNFKCWTKERRAWSFYRADRAHPGIPVGAVSHHLEFYWTLGSSLAVVTEFMAQERGNPWFWTMMLSQHWNRVTGKCAVQ